MPPIASLIGVLRRRAREGGSYLVRVTLAGNCSWMQDFGLFSANEVHGAGLPESMLASPGLNARLRPEFDLPTVTSTGPLGEMSVLPPQVELSEFKLGPRFSGDPNGASKLLSHCLTQVFSHSPWALQVSSLAHSVVQRP